LRTWDEYQIVSFQSRPYPKTKHKELLPLRKIFFASFALCLVLVTLSAAGLNRSRANSSLNNSETNTIAQDAPGTRCTHLLYPKKGEKPLSARCTRLYSKQGKAGKIMPNKPPTAELKASSESVVLGCISGATPASCKPDTGKVTLSAKTTDADGDSLLFTFSTTGGRVTRDGPDVVWDLSGAQPGTYTATVEVDDGCGCVAFSSTTVSVAQCSDCQ
jgi:hypothetical protein